MVQTILTARLLLRPYLTTDAPAFFALLDAHRERLKPSFPDRVSSARTLADARGILAGFNEDWRSGRFYVFGIWEQGSGAYLGDICLMPQRQDSAEIGYYLAPEAEGQGYAREALAAIVDFGFTQVKARRLLIRCYDDNPRAHAVAEAVGFRLEATTDRPRSWWGASSPAILHFARLRENG